MALSNKGFIQELIQCCLAYGIETITFIDRLKLHYDGRSTAITLKPEKDTDTEREFSDAANLDRKLDLFRLSKDDLVLLRSELQGDYKINYIEFAIDFVTDEEALHMIETFFYQHLVKESSGEFYFYQEKQTVYYGPKGTYPNTLFYSDKKSKMSQKKYCLHLEIRIKGAKDIFKHADVITLNDVINFNYLSFFNEKLDFRRVNQKTLGACTYPSKDVTRQTKSKDSEETLQEISNLQEFLSDNPSYKDAFEGVMTTASIKTKLEEYSKNC